MENKKLLAKIKKLLALAKSPNPHEAASALAMAQKLMKEYQISQEDVEITTKESETLFARRTPMYIHKLLRVICLAFGCEGYLSKWDKAKAVFLGQEERPEIASYCFDVLYRKLMKARKEFIANQSKRLKRSTLIARADLYCEGWVQGVYENIEEFAMTPREKGLIERYMSKLNLAKAKVREAGNTRDGDFSGLQGYLDGKNVKLNHGVSGTEAMKLTGGM